MPKKADIYHSVLIVSPSDQFHAIVKRSLSGYFTTDVCKNVSLARRSILERYYDLVIVDCPLPDETGFDFAIDITEKCSASVLLIAPQDVFEDALNRVTDHGILVIPKPSPRGRIDKGIRYLIAIQNRIHELEKKTRTVEEKMEELRIVTKAKFMLVETRNMTEDEAHKFIGRMAMDNGISRGRAAQRILDDDD